MPYYPEDENKGHYEINTIEEKLISKYTGLNFIQIDELNIIEFWAYLRDSIIYKYNQTEKGQEYLEKCWIMEQKQPDRESLRNRFKKG
ncbi:hypothetical protein HYH38_07965 [Clostridium botulinum]|uniref:hypothetical protein n=1 Tax=Clostridium botulinum TaxID=1491 RepID=UPI000174E5F3|nr:hypothetical protein [Clostridium botulinum]ACD52380.1 hypothetical protein CLH_2109 [Clostridium botulinum E3 str. Alaska E43]MBY6816529.1 hypothetical protein [Clostridium botulinum]MBY6827216.1 hypothetical protein [Clostridium botulinum]MBY6859164.1 hypothetical protein [Clostridium botulinum]MBY7041552.1 hypothetical protein [Clostridium botulinum]